MSNLSTLPKGDSAWLFRKALERIIKQVSVLETNIGASTTGNSANTQVIFNDNGVLRGDPDFIFNAALNKLVALNIESTAALVVGTSATITGDLTVDTSTLKVDSTNNRVGIGTASPADSLNVVGNTILDTSAASFPNRLVIRNTNTGGYGARQAFSVYDYYNSAQFETVVLESTFGGFVNGGSLVFKGKKLSSSSEISILEIKGTGDVLVPSGNLGLGVTPSAWDGATGRSLELKAAGNAIAGFGTGDLELLSNAYYNSGYKYAVTGTAAANYQLNAGVHQWYTAPSGTAGNAITFTQAMTLDASGNLLVGTTTAGIGGSANTRFTVKGNSDTYFSLIASGGEEMIAACQAGVVKIGSFNNNRFELLQNNSTKVTIDTSGNFIPLLTATAPSLGTNSQMVFNLTSNTNLRISVRGTDGTTRTANITLA